MLLWYWFSPGHIIFTNSTVTIYIEQYDKEKREITVQEEKEKICNAISELQVNMLKNQYLLFADDGIEIRVYGRGIKYKNQNIGVVHIYLSEKNEINTIQLDGKDYSFKKGDTLLADYIL